MSDGAADPGQATAASKPRRKRRRWSFVITALMLGLIVSLLLVELGFRVFWQLPPQFAEFGQAGLYAAADDGTPMLQPGYRGTLQIGGDGPNVVAINRLGLRGVEIGDRQPGEQRVLIVGDSLVFGYGVEGDQALPARVEQALREPGLREPGLQVTVGNGGVPGLGSSHAVARMQHLDEAFGPDVLVVCGFLGNDAIDDALPRRVVYAGLMHQWPMAQLVHTSWRVRLALHSRAALWLESWIYANKLEWSPMVTGVPEPDDVARSAGLPPPPQRLAGLFLDARDENRVWQPGAPPVIPRLCGYLRESLQRARRIAGLRPVVFVVLPTSWHVNEDKRIAQLRAFGFDPNDYERGLAQQRWLAVAREVGVTALDATPILAAAGPSAALFIHDGGHLSELGNRVVGEWLAGELRPLLR